MSEALHVPVNQLLAALPDSEYQRLVPYLEPVSLFLGQALYEPGEPIREVYFPARAMISLVSALADNSTTEIGLVGNEGIVGLPAFLGGDFTVNRAIVQIAGNAMKLDASVLKREFDREGELQKRLLLYTQVLLTQISQISACKSRHRLEQQLARWLLLVRDCVGQDEFRLTQQFIAQMLGVRRASVTQLAGTFQRAGLIRYSRGQIAILNQSELEATACECYRLVRSESIRLLGTRPSS